MPDILSHIHVAILVGDKQIEDSLSILLTKSNIRYQVFSFFTADVKNKDFDLIITSGKLISSEMKKVSEIKIPKLFTTICKKNQTGDKAAGMGCHAILSGANSSESLFSGIYSAFYNFEREKEFNIKTCELEFKLKCRKFIVLAEVMVMKWFMCSEDDAYKLLRTSAMNKHVHIEELCIDLVSNPDLWRQRLKSCLSTFSS